MENLLEKEINKPKFLDLGTLYELKRALSYNSSLEFNKFLASVISKNNLSYSQLYQDLFVLYCFKNKTNGNYIEIGASDGIALSNSYLLEKKFNWTGVLVEPDPCWNKSLKNNRKKSILLNDCAWSNSGEKKTFYSSDIKELSTIEEFRFSDKLNFYARNKKGFKIDNVNTISLNDICLKYFLDKQIDYISIDTEGSEYKILETFDFSFYKVGVFTVEHNFTENQKKLTI